MTPTLEQAIKLVEGLNIVWQCPRCGSRHFGSTFGGNPLDVVSRICHDEYARGCNWSGPPPEVEPRDAILAAMEHVKAEIERLTARLTSAEKVVEKLPKTADGVTITPNMTVWCRFRRGGVPSGVAMPVERNRVHIRFDKPINLVDDGMLLTDESDPHLSCVFSTREAALAGNGEK